MGARKVASFQNHSLCLDDNGKVWAIGKNKHYQLGLGHDNNIKIPQNIKMNQKIIKIAVGMYHSLMLTEDGSLWTFGYNAQGNKQYIKRPTIVKKEYFANQRLL